MEMPSEIINWMNAKGWGDHHLRWHIERRWDRFEFWDQDRLPNQRVIPFARSQGWTRYDPQEGNAGNGIEFFAMHRAMILSLQQLFPQHAHLFIGWPEVPIDPTDAEDPVPVNDPTRPPGELHPTYVEAAARASSAPETYSDEDELGIFIQTTDLPTVANPLADSPDQGAGIHNALHGRFTRNGSPVNMGNPQVNIGNQRFWRLHGWIDRCWEGFRFHQGRPEDEAYIAALKEGARHMGVEEVIFPRVSRAEMMERELGHGGHDHHHAPLLVPPEVMATIIELTYLCPELPDR